LALAVAAAPASAAVQLTSVGSFTKPVYLTAPPGDPHRLLVVEQAGRVMEIRDGGAQATPFLDISADVKAGGEQGLLSIAFARDYAKSHELYAYYTAPRTGDAGGSVITIQRMTTSAGNPDVVDPASRRTLVTVEHPGFPNHVGGQLQVGPDGMLYAGTGDGGSGNDPPDNAQNPASRLGKLLRIDPRTGATSVYASGLRNPSRFSFDRATGYLVIADVGQGAYEEVDVARPGDHPGANYGWHCFEGLHSTGLCSPDPAGTVPPVLEKNHTTDGYCAIVGGYVVRDPDLTDLAGRYLYGDNCAAAIRSAKLVAPPALVSDDADTGLTVSGLTSFGEDSCGHVYATTFAGPVYRIDGDSFHACPEPPAPPSKPPVTHPPDRRAPVLAIGGRRGQRVLRQGGLRLRLRCDERCGVSLGGVMRVGGSRKRRKLAALTTAGGAHELIRVVLPLTARQRRVAARALRRHASVRFAIVATAHDAAGNAARRTKSVRARR
jgi:glucose/arabinose dehydrogenase